MVTVHFEEVTNYGSKNNQPTYRVGWLFYWFSCYKSQLDILSHTHGEKLIDGETKAVRHADLNAIILNRHRHYVIDGNGISPCRERR